jgi:hypothetical protein
MSRKVLNTLLTVAVICLLILPTQGSQAASTTKPLATNFTLANLSASTAHVTIDYYTTSGTAWKSSVSTDIAGHSQAIFRQYTDSALPAGAGSVVVSSDMPLASLVQILVPPGATGLPSSGAYVGVSAGSDLFYIPQVSRNGSSATGTARSQIVVQNVGTAVVDADIILTAYGSGTPTTTFHINDLAIGASYYYDITDDSNVSDGWWGSSVVDVIGTGSISVVSNLFFGSDGLMSFNGFGASEVTPTWTVPLFYSRLSNTLTTSLAIQNLSGVEIPSGDITLSCTPDPTCVGCSTFSVPYNSTVAINGVATYNSYSDTAHFPANWYGPCTVDSATDKGLVSLVLYRYTGNNEMSAYGAANSGSTDANAFVPLMAKRLGNGYANAATVVNLGGGTATADLIWTASADCSGCVNYTESAVTFNGSLIRNLRNSGGGPAGMPDGWFGTLQINSDRAVAVYVANTYITAVSGDRFTAYLGFTTP